MSCVNPRFRLPLGCRQPCEPPSPKRQIDGKLEVIYCVGGVISPILANIFLHTVLDEWFETTVRARMGGNCFLVRFADDFVMGYAFKGDAEKVFRVLPKRFERYGLSIHPEKSRLVQFSRPYWRQGKGPWV